MTTYADVRREWDAAAARLGVPPDQLARHDEWAAIVRSKAIETLNGPHEGREQVWYLAVELLQGIG